MCLHDNIKQIMLKFHTTEICACSHTLKGRWFKYMNLVYLNDFKTVQLRLIMFDWVQKLIRIKHSCTHIIGLIVFDYRTQINLIIVFNPVQFTEQF